MNKAYLFGKDLGVAFENVLNRFSCWDFGCADLFKCSEYVVDA